MIKITARNNNKLALTIKPFDRVILDKIKSLPNRNYDGDTYSWLIPAGDLDKVQAKFPDDFLIISDDVKVLVKRAEDEKQRQEAEKLKLEAILHEWVQDHDYTVKPYPHQITGICFALAHPFMILGDEQGLGKTEQAIVTAEIRKEHGLIKKALIICGVNSTKYNWQNEVKMHTTETAAIIDGSPAKRMKMIREWLENDDLFAILNIEMLRKEEIVDLLNGNVDMIIFDECHKAKNGRCQQGKGLHALNAKYKMALTGTPMTSKVLDLYNVISWLGVEKRSYYTFRNAYCEMGGYGHYEIVGYKNLDDLNRRLAEYMLRRLKEDVLDLPPKVHSTEYVEMTKDELAKYREALNGILEHLDEILDTNNPLTQLLRLRQITSGLFTEESSKLDRVKELIEDDIIPNGGKVIIFSNWSEVTKKYREALAEYHPAYITGEIKVENRQAEVDRFQNDPDCHIIIGTIGAMGTGLTLNKASTVIFLDKAWTAADNEQAEDRAHRIGTAGTVSVITMVAKNTVDEGIEARLAENEALFAKVVDGTATRETAKKTLLKILGVDEKELKKAKKKKAEAAKTKTE